MHSLPRLAIIGAGHLGSIHARIAARNSNFALAAIVDPDPDHRNRIASEHGALPFADINSARGEFDAAIIAAPTSLHYAIGMQLLADAIPLFIEKPLAPSAQEAGQLVDKAAARKTVLQVGHVERFNPAFRAVRDDLANPRYIESQRLSGFPFRSTDIGVVLDLMIHDIDLVLSIVDSDVVDIRATGGSVMGGHEDMASARIEFANGCVAQLTASRVSFDRRRTMSVVTNRQFVAMDFDSGRMTTVTPREDIAAGAFDVDALEANERSHLKDHFFEELLVRADTTADPVNAIELEQQDFAAAISGRATPQVGGGEGRDAVAVAESILIEIASADQACSDPRPRPHGTAEILAMPLRRAGRQAG